ncbi:MAG: hypothetical protein ACLT8E_03470 [Akkermansia sp.]
MMGIPLEPEQGFLQYLEVEKQASPHTVEVYARARPVPGLGGRDVHGVGKLYSGPDEDWLFQK